MSHIRLLAKKNQVATSAEPVEEVENIEQPSENGEHVLILCF